MVLTYILNDYKFMWQVFTKHTQAIVHNMWYEYSFL